MNEEQAVIVAAIRAELERQSHQDSPGATAIMEIMVNGWIDDLALADAMLAAFAKYHLY